MEEKKLELRMYLFTIYQLSGIQKGIQCGHAALKYAKKYKDDAQFNDFVDNWETWMVMNGGTTNDEKDETGLSIGGINQLFDLFVQNDLKFASFREPDLNNSMTALCIIVDERIFNFKDYPNFKDYVIINNGMGGQQAISVRTSDNEILKTLYPHTYESWLELIGGKQSEFLKELLPNYRWA